MSPYKDIDSRIADILGLKYPEHLSIISKHYVNLSKNYSKQGEIIKYDHVLYREFKEWFFNLEDNELKTIIILQELSR
jgi:hypothetical protein